MSKRRNIKFYEVSQPLYEKYKELESPIIECTAKKIAITGGDDLLILEFTQENGCTDESFGFQLPFSKKNIEEQLSLLFAEFSLKDGTIDK